MSNPEQRVISYDFSEEIDNAISNAPLVEMSESGLSLTQALDNASNLKGLAEETDDSLVYTSDDVMSGDIITEDAHAYPILVRQAMKSVFPPFTSKRQIDLWSRESLEHEMAHAAAANLLNKDVQYVVRIVKMQDSDSNTRLLMACYINIRNQKITKAELAFITAAPENLSEGDEQVLRSLGYASLIN